MKIWNLEHEAGVQYLEYGYPEWPDQVNVTMSREGALDLMTAVIDQLRKGGDEIKFYVCGKMVGDSAE